MFQSATIVFGVSSSDFVNSNEMVPLCSALNYALFGYYYGQNLLKAMDNRGEHQIALTFAPNSIVTDTCA